MIQKLCLTQNKLKQPKNNILSYIVKKFVIITLIFLLITGCSGIFISSNNLSKDYRYKQNNQELNVFFTPNKNQLNIAIKNMSGIFMSNLTISITCDDNRDKTTSIYSLGNLKEFFNKTLTVPVNYDSCKSIILNYTYNPAPYSYSNIMTDDYHKRNVPVSPYILDSIKGTIKLK